VRLALVVVAALALAPAAAACQKNFSMASMEGQVMCPVCGTTLDQSDSAAANQIRSVIRQHRAQGWTDCRVKRQLVADFGEQILAAPPKHGFDLLAWLLPLAGIVGGAAALGVGAWRWTKVREAGAVPVEPSLNGHRRLDPELERRLDEELARFE
jgi:cytochrome c-type biogenesis protein CcmH/NrfF